MEIIAELTNRIFDLKNEHESLNSCFKPSFLIDPDSDEYQWRLERTWRIQEIEDEIKQLESELDVEIAAASEITLWRARFTHFASDYLYVFYDDALNDMKNMLRMIYGCIPKYHDGFNVFREEWRQDDLKYRTDKISRYQYVIR